PSRALPGREGRPPDRPSHERPHRLAVRTLASHAGNTSSNLVGVTKEPAHLSRRAGFFLGGQARFCGGASIVAATEQRAEALGSRLHADLCEHVAYVIFQGVRSDLEGFGDVAVLEAEKNQLQGFPLAVREPGTFGEL